MSDDEARAAQQQLANLQTIYRLDELDGYQAEARKRGYLPGELTAILTRRNQITGRRR